MSFDFIVFKEQDLNRVSIPLEQGNVFRQQRHRGSGSSSIVSIPLEQGNVFRHTEHLRMVLYYASLNPFGTGQCLST